MLAYCEHPTIAWMLVASTCQFSSCLDTYFILIAGPAIIFSLPLTIMPIGLSPDENKRALHNT